jgi:Protein of unknown function (DUF3618)
MAQSSEQLEREIGKVRNRLTADIEELRSRITPGQMVDQIADYTREGPAAEFVTNLGREIRENPLPLLLTAAGIGWLIVASSLSRSRRLALPSPAMQRQLAPAMTRESYELDEAADATVAAE